MRYNFRKFKDGWWSLIYQLGGLPGWVKWRGPFDTKADAEIDCNIASRGRYEL